MPSLALLAFLIALVGSIGVVPALIALFLYALLPIVRNTHAGLQGVSREHGAGGAVARHDARARRCAHVQLPLAAPMLLAGIKTAAVINVGTATMAAFIGAGGFGERIVAGLAVNDSARDARRRAARRRAGAARPGRRSISPSGWARRAPAALTRRARDWPRGRRCDNRGCLSTG